MLDAEYRIIKNNIKGAHRQFFKSISKTVIWAEWLYGNCLMSNSLKKAFNIDIFFVNKLFVK